MYLVVGANGFLGSYVLKNIMSLTDEKIVAVAKNINNFVHNSRIEYFSCDISNFEEVDTLCRSLNGKYRDINVIFLAAYHHPDLVEENPRFAWNINITALSYFVNRLRNVRCFFYPSTDSVYGNSVDSYHYKEEDILNPVNVYGRQKALAECIVNSYGYNVVRYPFLISPSLSPNKKHFYDFIVESLNRGEKVEMFCDSYRSSLDFDTAAKLLLRLITSYRIDMPKILNICGDDDLSKYDVGLKIADKLNVSRDLIIPITADASEGIYKAERAKSTLMNNSKLKSYLNLKDIKLNI